MSFQKRPYKRFLILGDYYCGRVDEVIGHADTLEEAKEIIRKDRESTARCDHYDILDLELKEHKRGLSISE